ncbi:MAG: hypothetical protein RBU21_07325, partial [FCB group bacterium]|nr:hypothetical protein [FCB group bacterium]
MSEPFESEADRDQSLEETCAGLVYADTRTLEQSELKSLRRAKWRHIGAGVGMGLLALAVLFALLLFLMTLPEESAGPYLKWGILLVIGAPTALVVFAFKSMERAEPLRSVLKDGRVRIYKGHLNLADPTDANLHFLRKAG